MEVDVKTVKAKLDSGADFLLLDCREREEYEKVRLESATLIPMSELAERASELTEHRGRSIVVYCHHGGRSLMVAEWLRGQGFANAESMAGGIDEWSLQIDSSCPRY